MSTSEPSCCIPQGCFDCYKTTEYINTVPVFTPFYRPIGEGNYGTCPQPLSLPNYLPYDLFCLETKLNRYLYKLDRTYHVSFVSKEIDNLMRVTVDLYKGSTFVPMNEKLASQVQKYVDKSASLYPDYCLLFDARIPIRRGGKRLTKAWVASIVPFISLEERFHPLIEDSRIFINIREDPSYNDRYARMYDIIIDTLFEYFERGIISLSPIYHRQLIDDWKLELIHQQYHHESIDGDLGLYEPRWRNNHFAPNPVDFLYQRVAKEEQIQIQVGDNFVRRHFVAIALNKLKKKIKDILPEEYIPTFFQEYVLVPAKNLKDAFIITDTVLSAQSKSSGEVNIVPLERSEDYKETETKILDKYVTLIPGEDLVLYHILDIPPYVTSMLVPTGPDTLLFQSNKE